MPLPRTCPWAGQPAGAQKSRFSGCDAADGPVRASLEQLWGGGDLPSVTAVEGFAVELGMLRVRSLGVDDPFAVRRPRRASMILAVVGELAPIPPGDRLGED